MAIVFPCNLGPFFFFLPDSVREMGVVEQSSVGLIKKIKMRAGGIFKNGFSSVEKYLPSYSDGGASDNTLA